MRDNLHPADRHEVVPAQHAHLHQLCGTLRDGDRKEIEVAGFRSPYQVLRQSFRGSLFSKTAFVDGQIAAMWGMGAVPLGRVGRPWLLTAPAIERAPVAIVRTGRAEVANMLSICSELRGFVDASYIKAHRLLDALGFELSAPFAFGSHGALFLEYKIVFRA